ncbi:potassium efflux system protein [Cytobacillus firmus]|uniref:Potassium efflux system protein n=2 Tax=Cytobacillus TaxID=2675230 RepID=A0A366JQE8_CYTFI|nr:MULTISPECIES: mechanosensitive ion channel domain-containing protein [Cytobacillus]RBP90527.1 potassium efflux system protein [Cytobacillus firmus]TDX46109.1 potassium efflux system protein [Cytobacillus oceanisediminis]
MLFIKNVTIKEAMLFLLFAGVILAAKWTVNLLVKKWKGKSVQNDRIIQGISSLVNWAAFYGIIILFLFYFSREKWLFYTLFTAGDVDVTLYLIIVAFLTVSLANRIVKVFTKYVLTSVYEFYGVDRGLGYSFNRMIYYTVMIAALAISLTTVGLDLTAAAALLGVLGIGIGFGMRNIAGNFISGIIILFERPIEIGEVIEINNKIGRIESIRLRSTIVRTAKEGTLIVPNQYFIEQIIKNRTGSEMLAQVLISVAYGTDTDKVEKLLREAVDVEMPNTEGVLSAPAPDIRFVDFRNKAMDFLIEVPVANFEAKQKFESRLRHVIAERFYKNGIELASAQLLPGE